MGGINLSVHPLFFLFGVYYAATGRIFIFAVYTLTAVVHELGHSFVASGAGYRLNKIKLMPFGAVVSGKTDGMKFSDEVKIAFAGPLINIAIGLFFVSTWWIYPESYAFTDVVAEANFSMAIINLLPVYPLDGGRILAASLSCTMGSERAYLICKITGVVFSILLIALFIISAFGQLNLSLLFFSLFVLFGALGKGKDNKYVKIYTAVSEERLKRGLPIKRFALSKNCAVKKMIRIMDETAINEIAVYDGERQITVLSQKRIREIIEKGSLYAPLSDFI